MGEHCMALYKDNRFLTETNDPSAFEKEYRVGLAPDHSGIFRCVGCGREVVAEKRRKIPTQNDHQHLPSQGPIVWRMIVSTEHQTT